MRSLTVGVLGGLALLAWLPGALIVLASLLDLCSELWPT